MFMMSLYLMMGALMFFYGSLLCMTLKMSCFLEWELFFFSSVSIEMVIVLDWMSLVFVGVVFFISSVVLTYSLGYMYGDKSISRFFMLMVMFVVSMVMLILTPNIISLLIGWDGLGLISYCLVIYYSSPQSYNFGMITLLCNRVGDVSILVLIGLLLSKGSWNLIFYSEASELTIFLLMLSSMTKSAQIPFSTWLPKAMAAPTPVSSLVHSSTLVTAGVYLMIRYGDLFFNSFSVNILFILSSLTMFMSGISANLENDLKKIIAFSTLSQLGLMMSVLCLGQGILSFFHLLVHAMFKSLLFLSAGSVIHTLKDNQDIRLMGGLVKMMPFTMVSFFCSLVSLCGFPFLSGFYSKDLIMEYMIMSNINFFVFFILILSTILTVSYSVRLMMYMCLGGVNLPPLFMIHSDSCMNYSSIFLFFMSIFGGSAMSWLYFDSFDLIFLPVFLKLFILLISFLGVGLGVAVYYLNFMNQALLVEFLGSMWYIDKFIVLVNKITIMFSLMGFSLDKFWIEGVTTVPINFFLSYFTLLDLNMMILVKLFVFIIFLLS